MDLETLAGSLPDIPRWVETRGLLLSGRGRVIPSPGGFLVKAVDGPLVCSIGRPDPEAFQEAVADPAPDLRVLAPLEEAEHLARALPGWRELTATIHLLSPGRRPAVDPAADIRLLQDESLLELLPGFVYEVQVKDVSSRRGQPLLNPSGFYTLNRLLSGATTGVLTWPPKPYLIDMAAAAALALPSPPADLTRRRTTCASPNASASITPSATPRAPAAGPAPSATTTSSSIWPRR